MVRVKRAYGEDKESMVKVKREYREDKESIRSG